MELQNFSTAQLQQIACEQITRLTSRANAGNARLANDCLEEIVKRESVAWLPGWAGPAPMAPVRDLSELWTDAETGNYTPEEKMSRALGVVTKTPEIRQFLEAHDPMALRQCLMALGELHAC